MFEGKRVRRVWDGNKEDWMFSIVDIVDALVPTDRPRKYWNDLKIKLKEEGSELSEKIGQLKLESSDGKYYDTDVADTETVFRIIQSIPSPKAEPFKLWLARVGYERIEESVDPEKTINRALNTYLKQGRTPEWTNLRLKSIEIRKDLTNEWENRGVRKNDEFAILTDEITKAWAGMTTKSYKNYKGLKKESLRDNMTNLELVLNMLGETATTEISKKDQPETFLGNKLVARRGGSVAGTARKQLEKEIGKNVISRKGFVKRLAKGKYN